MKPNFALSLSFDGLHLLHRAEGGWHSVGQVTLDDPDLTGALARLKTAAEGLDPAPLSTKLLIPNDQIKYMALETTLADATEVRTVLDGATPYAVDDLVFDFTTGGGRTYVAAVARETLQEADDFAREHGFNPVSFAAVPEPFTYVGEAFFGAASEQTVERDAEAVGVIETAAAAVPAPQPGAPKAVPTDTAVSPDVAAASLQIEAATETDQLAPKAGSRPTAFGASKPPTPQNQVVGGKPQLLGLMLTAALLLLFLGAAAFATLSSDTVARWLGLGGDTTQIAEPAATPLADAQTVAAVMPPPPPPAVDANEPTVSAANTPQVFASTGRLLTPEEAQRIYAATGVWQRAPRIQQVPRASTLDGLDLVIAARPVPRLPASPLMDANRVAGDAVIATPIDPPPPSATFNFDRNGRIVATPEGTLTPDGILVFAGAPPLSPPTRPGTVAPVTPPQDQLAAVVPDTATVLPDAPNGVIVISGAPAIVPPVRTGTAAPAAPLLATDDLLVLAGSPPVLPPVRPGTIAPATDQPVAAAPEAVDPTTQPLAEETPDTTPENVTVIAGPPPVLPPVRPGTTAPTPAPATDQPVAAAPEAVDPTTQPLAEETPDTTPENVTVIAGPPPVLPPVRPGTVVPQRDAGVDGLSQDAATALATSTAQAPNADTPRPLLRPTTIVEAATARADTPVVGNLTIAQATAFRPRTRPGGLAPAPEAVATPEPEGLQIAPELAAAVQAAAARPSTIINPTRQAVASSARPDTRPRNMARIVERAQAAQARAPQQVAAVAPRTVQPSGPTGSAVAQNATLSNAINLRDINLIGIYGGSGDRRALVRLANGRFQRVTVGDRLDGGRVTAISESRLSYTRSGRAVTLEVPG